MEQRTDASARRAGLWRREPLRASKGQSFRGRLSHRASQGMPGRLQFVKPRILLEQGANLDPQPIRKPQKSHPFLFAQLLARHKSFILEPGSFLPRRSIPPNIRSSIQKYFKTSY